jgi:hypothetical protein
MLGLVYPAYFLLAFICRGELIDGLLHVQKGTRDTWPVDWHGRENNMISTGKFPLP